MKGMRRTIRLDNGGTITVCTSNGKNGASWIDIKLNGGYKHDRVYGATALTRLMTALDLAVYEECKDA